MKNIIGIVLLLIGLFAFDCLFYLVPIFVLVAEIYAFVLDKKQTVKKQKNGSRLTNVKLTWQELKQHNTADSAYLAISNKVYDVTDFLEQHPGGKEYLLMNAGRDVTLAFQCYHSLTTKPEKLLEKYCIGELITNEHPQFKEDSGFYKECSQKIKEYLDSKGINPKTPIPGLCRAIPLWGVMGYTIYLTFFSFDTSMKVRILSGITFGICQALNNLHLMHDSSHSAAGNNENWWWFFGRLTLDYMSGASMLAWHNQHVLGHHIYTNVMGADPDLPTKKAGDVRRIVPQQVWAKLYEWQYIYMPILYGLLTIRTRYYDIFEIFLEETNGPVKVNPISRQDQIRQASSKLFWIFWRYFIPVRVLGMPLTTFFVLFFIVEFVTGYWLAINFQVSHVSDVAEFYYNNLDNLEKTGTNEKWNMEWAILQIKGSVDYGHHSWIQTYLSGALNYQVVHHLYPGISQYLYPQIAPIVKDMCKKHGIKYNEVHGFKEAWTAHINHLVNLGKDKKFVGFKME